MPSLTEDGGNTIGEDRSTLRDVLLCYPPQRYSIISVFNEVMRECVRMRLQKQPSSCAICPSNSTQLTAE